MLYYNTILPKGGSNAAPLLDRELAMPTIRASRPGWIDDSSLRERLGNVVRIMIRGQYNFPKRIEIASSYLVPLRIEDFPSDLRAEVETLLGVHALICRTAGGNRYFAFSDLTPTQRGAWTAALLKIYESLMRDVGQFDRNGD